MYAIRSEADYHAALAELGPLLDNEPEESSPEGAWLRLLVLTIDRFEREQASAGVVAPALSHH